MCGAVRFSVDGEERVAVAGNKGAHLPVVTRGGGLARVEWGASDDDERIHLNPVDGPGKFLALPRGYWVPLEELRTDSGAHWWGRKVRPVKIAASSFLVWINRDGVVLEQWITLRPGEFIQGALAHISFSQRVYVVTVQPPMQYASAKPCWPRVVRKLIAKTKSRG